MIPCNSTKLAVLRSNTRCPWLWSRCWSLRPLPPLDTHRVGSGWFSLDDDGSLEVGAIDDRTVLGVPAERGRVRVTESIALTDTDDDHLRRESRDPVSRVPVNRSMMAPLVNVDRREPVRGVHAPPRPFARFGVAGQRQSERAVLHDQSDRVVVLLPCRDAWRGDDLQ